MDFIFSDLVRRGQQMKWLRPQAKVRADQDPWKSTNIQGPRSSVTDLVFYHLPSCYHPLVLVFCYGILTSHQLENRSTMRRGAISSYMTM